MACEMMVNTKEVREAEKRSKLSQGRPVTEVGSAVSTPTWFF